MLQDLETRKDASPRERPKAVYEDLRPVKKASTERLRVLASVGVAVVAVSFIYLWASERWLRNENKAMAVATASTQSKPATMPVPPLAFAPTLSPLAATPPPNTVVPQTVAVTPPPVVASEPQKPVTVTATLKDKAEEVRTVSPKKESVARAATPEETARAQAPAVAIDTKAVMEKKVRPVSAQEQADNYYAAAADFLHKGRAGDAIANLKSALTANPDHHKARELLVGLTLQHGRWQEGQQLLEQGIARHPRHLGFSQMLARVHIERGADQRALAVLESAGDSARADPEFLAFLAALYQRTGRHADAAKAYTDAVNLRPDEGRWWLGLAISLEAEQKWPGASQAYTRARLSAGLDPQLVRYADQRLAALKNK